MMGRAKRLLHTGAAASIVVSLMPLVAIYWWVFDLFTHFRLQLVVVQIGLLAVLALLGSKRWCALLAVCALLNMASLRSYLMPQAQAEPAVAALSVMSVNVLSTNTHSSALMETIAKHSPDVILVLEYTQHWADALKPLSQEYPHRFERPETGNFGLALYSKLPFTDMQELDLQGVVGIETRLSVAGEHLRIIGVHLRPPISGRGASDRQLQLARIEKLVGASEDPVAVLGDFNLSPYSPHFSRFLKSTGLRDALVGHGPRITWPSFMPALGIPIDHCLVSEGLLVTGYERLSHIGSDHYPIVVDIGIDIDRQESKHK